jgi:hypothetical protein
LRIIVIKKSQYLKIVKNDEDDFIGRKVVYCRLKKTMMPTESSWNFFTISLRIVTPHIAERFSLAGEGHRNGGRFLVELPIRRRKLYKHIPIEK